MMKRSSLAIASFLAASLLAACMSPVIGDKTATIVIATAPAPGARALTETWPMGGLPVFSDITVSVLDAKGHEMLLPREPVVSGNSITVTVTAGKDMTLIVDAKPDWDATAIAYDMALTNLMTLVNMYSGREGLSVNAGDTAAVTITLSTSGTKILIPDPNNNGSLGIADSLSSSELSYDVVPSVSVNSFFAYDKYGHLFVSNSNNVSAYQNVTLDASGSLDFVNTNAWMIRDIAISEISNRVYGFNDNDGAYLFYRSLDPLDTATTEVTLSDSNYSYDLGGVAVDSNGYVYIPGGVDTGAMYSTPVMLKLAVQDSTATVMASPALSDLGLGYWYNNGDSGMVFYNYPIEDMAIVNDILYVVASDTIGSPTIAESSSRGKLVAIDTNTMEKKWEVGFRSDTAKLPTAGGDSLFYGPRRIVGILPKKLYIVDDGFYWNGDTWGYPYVDVNRIIEIDTDSGEISAVGLNGISNFYDIYSGLYVM